MASSLRPPLPVPAQRFKHDGIKNNCTTAEGTRPSSSSPSKEDSGPTSNALGSLPTISQTKSHHVYLVETDIETFLQKDLDLSRLNVIHKHLWMAGRPLNARPLQRQKMLGFEVLSTDQVDLHFLKVSDRLFIKPLPEYMLDYDFWKQYLCDSKELHQSACGFLLSYTWLICSPLDLRLARDLHLVPDNLTWEWWKVFVTNFYSEIDMNALDQVNKRYHFGELRLGRINSIYRLRFFSSHFVRGYLYTYNRYGIFWQRNFEWLVAAFVYVSIVLSAMEVGASVPPLSENHAFQQASYGFVVFSIVMVVFVLGFVAVLFSGIYLYNMVAAIWDSRRGRLERQEIAERRKKMNKDV